MSLETKMLEVILEVDQIKGINKIEGSVNLMRTVLPPILSFMEEAKNTKEQTERYFYIIRLLVSIIGILVTTLFQKDKIHNVLGITLHKIQEGFTMLDETIAKTK